MIRIVLLVLAIICFALAAFKAQTPISWRDAGFAFVTAAILVPA